MLEVLQKHRGEHEVRRRIQNWLARPKAMGLNSTSLLEEKNQGARMPRASKDKRDVLQGVLAKVKQWFDNEGEYGHDVRDSHIREQTKHELMCERNRQEILHEHEAKGFDEQVRQACQEKSDVVQAPPQ